MHHPYARIPDPHIYFVPMFRFGQSYPHSECPLVRSRLLQLLGLGTLNQEEWDYVMVMPLYAFGSNGSGQLGVGHTTDLSRPTLHKTEATDEPTAIRAGGSHTIIIYHSGNVAFCGKVLLSAEPDVHLQSRFLNVRAKLCAANWDTVIF